MINDIVKRNDCHNVLKYAMKYKEFFSNTDKIFNDLEVT